MDVIQILEWAAGLLGLVYIFFLIKENIWCWFFGIISSTCFIFLMYNGHLYSESILYAFYIGVGFYGWFKWSNKNKNKIVIKRASTKTIIILLVFGVICSYGVGTFFSHETDAARPYADATTSIFSVIATFMEANKFLSTWVFWVCINFFSIWLYIDRGFKVSAMLMVVYFLLSIFGFLQWQKNLQGQVA